jgi:hypothetical protein
LLLGKKQDRSDILPVDLVSLLGLVLTYDAAPISQSAQWSEILLPGCFMAW